MASLMSGIHGVVSMKRSGENAIAGAGTMDTGRLIHRVLTTPWVSTDSGSGSASRPPDGFDAAVRWCSRAGSTDFALVELDCDEGAARVETNPWVSASSGTGSAFRPPCGVDAAVRWRSHAGWVSVL